MLTCFIRSPVPIHLSIPIEEVYWLVHLGVLPYLDDADYFARFRAVT